MSEPFGEGPIKFQFIIGGGPFLDFDYGVVGGPDNKKRLRSLPVRKMDHRSEYYNGTEEEFNRIYGTAIRPCWRPEFWSDKFSPETVEAATKEFGPLCKAYIADHSERS